MQDFFVVFPYVSCHFFLNGQKLMKNYYNYIFGAKNTGQYQRNIFFGFLPNISDQTNQNIIIKYKNIILIPATQRSIPDFM